jgi:hypothetical protein
MKPRTFIGIDVGKDGAIAVCTDNRWSFFKIPLINTEIDCSTTQIIFKTIRESSDDIHAVIEDVHSIFGASSKSTFQFGRIAGILEMALVANNIPFTLVQPKTWQKEMWQGVSMIRKPSKSGKTMVNDTKAMSLIAARRLFPMMDFKRTPQCTKPDDGIVDAVLMCEYCKRKKM